MTDLIAIITATDPALRNQPLEAACAELSLEELLEQCAGLDAFRRRSENLYERVRALLTLAGLPTVPPRIGRTRALELMQMDKKVLAGAVRLILLERLGSAIVTSDYAAGALEATLTEYLE